MKTLTPKSRQRLDERLKGFNQAELFQVPNKGWLRAVRDALGMSGVQMARRLGVSPQSVDALETSEANGTIKLETLRRAAEALDCRLVYAVVPNTTLENAVMQRARKIAIRELNRVSHTMRLEAQGTGNENMEDRIADYIREHVKDRDIWNEQ